MLAIFSMRKRQTAFMSIERVIVQIIIGVAVLDCILLSMRDVRLDWVGYGSCLAIGFGLMAMGLLYRLSGRDLRIGAALISASLYILFALAFSTLNYMFLPTLRAPVDAALAKIDLAFGFDWVAFCTWFSTMPWLSDVMRIVYQTSLMQIIFVIAYLAFVGKIYSLHRLILAFCISACATLMLWVIFPGSGASATLNLPLDVESAIRPFLTSQYIHDLVSMGRDGVSYISPRNIKGLIGFPSYHTVIAVLVVYGAMHMGRFLALLFILTNIIMIPAIIVHGAHNLSDVIAGFIVALLSLWAANYIARRFANEYD